MKCWPWNICLPRLIYNQRRPSNTQVGKGSTQQAPNASAMVLLGLWLQGKDGPPKMQHAPSSKQPEESKRVSHAAILPRQYILCLKLPLPVRGLCMPDPWLKRLVGASWQRKTCFASEREIGRPWHGICSLCLCHLFHFRHRAAGPMCSRLRLLLLLRGLHRIRGFCGCLFAITQYVLFFGELVAVGVRFFKTFFMWEWMFWNIFSIFVAESELLIGSQRLLFFTLLFVSSFEHITDIASSWARRTATMQTQRYIFL